MRAALAIATLALGAAACFSPELTEGRPCSARDECPRGLMCVDDGCVRDPSAVDGAVDDMPDGALPTAAHCVDPLTRQDPIMVGTMQAQRPSIAATGSGDVAIATYVLGVPRQIELTVVSAAGVPSTDQVTSGTADSAFPALVSTTAGFAAVWEEHAPDGIQVGRATLPDTTDIWDVHTGEAQLPAAAARPGSALVAAAWDSGAAGARLPRLAIIDMSAETTLPSIPLTDTPPANTPAIYSGIAASPDRIAAAWVQGTLPSASLLLQMVDWQGALLGAATQVSATSNIKQPSLAATDDGGFGIAWSDSGIATALHFVLADRDGQIAPRRVIHDDGGAIEPSLIWTGDCFAVAWQQDEGGMLRAIWFVRLTKSGTVLDATPIEITPLSANALAPSLMYTGQDYVIVYQDSAGLQLVRLSP